jgi:hypothetical protein
VSSSDGWLVETRSPSSRRGLCRQKWRPKAGEGRAYTQNPAAAQARQPPPNARETGRAPLDSLLPELYWVSALILKSQKTQSVGGGRSAEPEARSSVVEHYLDTVGVDSSILPAPTHTTTCQVVAAFVIHPVGCAAAYRPTAA